MIHAMINNVCFFLFVLFVLLFFCVLFFPPVFLLTVIFRVIIVLASFLYVCSVYFSLGSCTLAPPWVVEVWGCSVGM